MLYRSWMWLTGYAGPSSGAAAAAPAAPARNAMATAAKRKGLQVSERATGEARGIPRIRVMPRD